MPEELTKRVLSLPLPLSLSLPLFLYLSSNLPFSGCLSPALFVSPLRPEHIHTKPMTQSNI